MLCCRSLHGSSKTPQPCDASVTICTRVYIGVYAALLHGFSHLPSVVSSAPDVAASASRVQLDSPWFAAPRGQSSCRVQFAVSSSVRPPSSSPPPLQLRLRSDTADADEVVIWTWPANWSPTPRFALALLVTIAAMM